MSNEELHPLNIKEIMDLLPHRYPFILVDRVIDYTYTDEKKVLKAIKNVTINEPFFQGHFPGHPIMPGVLVTEAMAQVGACLILSSEEFKGCLPYLAALDRIRFKRPVRPGDQLRIEVEITQVKRNVGKMIACAKVDDKVVAEGTMLCSIIKA